jgi:hypothetical protein
MSVYDIAYGDIFIQVDGQYTFFSGGRVCVKHG